MVSQHCHSCPSLPPQYTVLQRTILYLLSTGGYDCTLGAIPLYHMGWAELYQGFIHTQTGHANPNLSVLSHCTTWDRWDCTKDLHVQCAYKSYMSILSHCTTWHTLCMTDSQCTMRINSSSLHQGLYQLFLHRTTPSPYRYVISR